MYLWRLSKDLRGQLKITPGRYALIAFFMLCVVFHTYTNPVFEYIKSNNYLNYYLPTILLIAVSELILSNGQLF